MTGDTTILRPESPLKDMTQEERDKYVNETLQLLTGLSVEKATKIADAFDRKDREIAELKSQLEKVKDIPSRIMNNNDTLI